MPTGGGANHVVAERRCIYLQSSWRNIQAVAQTLSRDELIRAKRDEILRIAAEHGVRNIRVFGSIARGDSRPDSDIDFLVEAGPVTSSWFPAGLILDLENLLGRPVEVVIEQGLHALIRDQVLQEALPV